MIKLPKVLLGDDLPRVLEIVTQIEELDGPENRIDASELITAEPVALCLLARALNRLDRIGMKARIEGVSAAVANYLARMDVIHGWLSKSENADLRFSDPQAPIQARKVSSSSEANAIANVLAQAVAAFVPFEDVALLLDQEDAEIRRYRTIDQPVGYVLAELLDNALNHGRSHGFAHASAWVAAQYYPSGDLLRVCVVDEGCGFLRSLRNSADLKQQSDAGAIHAALQPFVSSKRDVGIFRDAIHQGIGLTVCRDLCNAARGSLDIASGRAWLRNPGLPSQATAVLPTPYQGAVVSLTLHRRALTPGMIASIVEKYDRGDDLPIRFL